MFDFIVKKAPFPRASEELEAKRRGKGVRSRFVFLQIVFFSSFTTLCRFSFVSYQQIWLNTVQDTKPHLNASACKGQYSGLPQPPRPRKHWNDGALSDSRPLHRQRCGVEFMVLPGKRSDRGPPGHLDRRISQPRLFGIPRGSGGKSAVPPGIRMASTTYHTN